MQKHKVLLLGDSIRLGYCPHIRESLKETCDVYYPEDNCRYTTYTYVSLKGSINQVDHPETISVIHWNNGHWDVAHWDKSPESLNSPEVYAQMLERIYCRLTTYCPNAKIIFATTTPVNPANHEAENPRSREEIMHYNETAKQVMNKLGVEVNDLFSVASDFTEADFIDHAHFTEAGYKILAGKVCEKIVNNL